MSKHVNNDITMNLPIPCQAAHTYLAHIWGQNVSTFAAGLHYIKGAMSRGYCFFSVLPMHKKFL